MGRGTPPRHRLLGLAVEESAPGDQLKIQLSGYMILPTTSWDIVTGTVGGLSHNGTYFVDSNSKLSVVAPTQSPEYLIKMGQSINPTTFLIDLDIAIKL